MSKFEKTLNDIEWEKLFEKYNIIQKIEQKDKFIISATQIKEFREPRLMAKFDHTINLPKIFASNKLTILPITRGEYIISHFEAYHQFENNSQVINKVSLPTYIQSLNYNKINSEAIALNCAFASGMLSDFLDEEALLSTISGRMGSGQFQFEINNINKNIINNVSVNNSQIEIDGAYEGVNCLAFFEAKRDLSEDFLIRQLYYPFRVLQERVTKIVRPIFLIYSNGIYYLSEYKFQNPCNYNSLMLVKQKNYSIEDTEISILDIQNILNSVSIKLEPVGIPFPQANSFERVINVCELLSEQELSRNHVTEKYAFDVRQTNYYTDAARYLGLIENKKENRIPIYCLSKIGRKILTLNFKQRQLAYCKLILSHKTFNHTLQKYFDAGSMPSKNDIVKIMKNANLYNVNSDSTFYRRASTITKWINWIIDLINE